MSVQGIVWSLKIEDQLTTRGGLNCSLFVVAATPRELGHCHLGTMVHRELVVDSVGGWELLDGVLVVLVRI